MTPAVETSFINTEDSINKKKHVYTNMLPQANEMFTDDVDNTPNLKQTSIISFIKEMAEKSAKKKRGRSVSLTKVIYQDIGVNGAANKNKKPTKKGTENKPAPPSNNTSEEVSSSGNDASIDKETSKEERRTRKTKIAKIISSDAVNKVYEELKSPADAPVFPEMNVEDNPNNVEDLDINDDSQSVHLFEDIEVVHHLKEKEAEVWTAQFNSMCEDVEDFPLLVE